MVKRIVILVAALFVIAPASASASFHLMKITEVFPGTVGNPDSAFVELQMFQSGQNAVIGHSLRTYNAAGAVLHTYNLPGNAANGENQRTILIADEFPPDGVAEDFTDTALGTNIVAAGGAVCFDSVDCVSWGNYAGPALPSPAGTPAPAIPDETSLTRSITNGCPTALDVADDTNNSATDFSLTPDETPRPNSVAPPGPSCEPETIINKGPRKQTRKRKAKFKFSSPDAVTGFECSLDGKRFKPCSSPRTYKRLRAKKHTFEVRAVAGGTTDPTPATYKWKIKKPKS